MDEDLVKEMLDSANGKTITKGSIFAIVGGLLMAFGVFFPWMHAGFDSASAFLAIGARAWFFVAVGVLAAILGLRGVSPKNMAIGGIAGLYLLYIYYTINSLGVVQIGIGLYMSLLGAISTFVSGVIGFKSTEGE